MTWHSYIVKPGASIRKWRGQSCTTCGARFKVGDKVWTRTSNTRKDHLCEDCYDSLYVIIE